MKKQQAENSIKFLFKYVYKYSEGRRSQLWLYIGLFVISNVINQSQIFYAGSVFNYIQQSGINSGNINQILILIFGFFVIPVTFWLFHGPARIIEQNLAFYISNSYRDYLYANTLELPLTFHNEEHSGQIINRINKAVLGLQKFAENLFVLIRSFSAGLATFIALYLFDFKFFVFGLIMLVITYVINAKFEKRINPERDGINKKDNIISEIIYDTISNITTLKMLSLTHLVHDKLNKQVSLKLKHYKKKVKLNEIKWFMPALLSSLAIQGVLLSYVYNIYLLGSTVLLGSLYILYEYLNKLESVMNDIAWLMSSIQDEARDVYNSISLAENFKLNDVKEVDGEANVENVKIQNLNFSYGENFDLKIDELEFERGKSYALVGESGCGKSTTMKILASLIEVDDYKLIVNNKVDENIRFANIKEISMLIPQDPELFSNTIRENLTLGLPYASDEIDEVLDMVNLKEVVYGLPSGIESKIYEKGVNLSGGQKQRLALARGILFARDKEIILLDEPTSSVDEANEKKIYNEILELTKDKILISSVHKSHLLGMFDYVIKFENGKVISVEKG